MYLRFPIQVYFSATVAISAVAELLFSSRYLEHWPLTLTFDLDLRSAKLHERACQMSV